MNMQLLASFSIHSIHHGGCTSYLSRLLNLVKSYHSKEIYVVYYTYLQYLYKADTIVFNIIFSIRRAECHPSSTIIDIVSLFGYVIYFTAGKTACVTQRINYIGKYKLIFVTMEPQRWTWDRSIEQMMVNTMVLTWWRYLKHLSLSMTFSYMRQCRVTEDVLSQMAPF